MANDKITITGENIQGFSFASDWGGTNNTGSAATIFGTSVPPGSEWGVNHGEIERVIKQKAHDLQEEADSKIGSFRFSPNENADGYVLLGFKSEEDNLEWYSMSDSDKWGEAGLALIIKSAALPSLSGDTHSVRLTLQSSPSATQATDDVKINVKGISQITYGSSGQTEDVGEDLQMQIQTRTSQSAAWTSRGSISIQSNLQTFTSVSLKPYLVSGNNYVRIRMVSDDGTSSQWTILTLNVVALSLVAATPVASPVSGNTLELRYYIGGSADKTLRLQFGHYANSAFVTDYSYETTSACVIPIGTAVYASVAKVIELTPSTGVLDNILTAGNHVVRAKLYVSETVQTDWVETEYMVAGDTPTVVVNNIASGIENYTDVSFFKWAASQAMNVRFRLTNAGQTVTYATWEETAVAGTEKTLSTQLGIDSQLETINAYMHIEDLEGNALHDTMFFAITNNADFAPVSNPTFVFQPSTRSNSEANPRTIINAATGQVVSSEGWETFSMVSDGYNEGAFIVRAGSNLAIDINPLVTLCNPTDSDTLLNGRSATIELDFKASNITNEKVPIIRLGDYMNTENDHDIYGLEVLPTEAALLTKNERVREDQSTSWAEDRRTRLTINIVYGLNPDNDPTGTRLNYVRLFVDDSIEKEFNYGTRDESNPRVYNATDSFIGSDAAKLLLGSTDADLTIYGIRCYTKALSTDDVQRDYRAALPTTAEKRAWIAKNDILGQDGAIDYEKAKNAGYNVIGHTGHLPAYGDENKGKTTGVSLDIHLHDEPHISGILTNLENQGQGTTAMTYKDWNQQYKITDNTVFIAEDGTVGEAGAGYTIQAGEAAAKKLVGKINFASSMQGHKMSLARAYNDLYKQMVAQGQLSEPSQITRQPSARLAVYERPFLFFHRETANDPWTFRYLMTFGAGKGDKPTFGFDKNATPSFLMVEGADNDRPLALFTAPWNDQVTYDAEKEAWMLAGAKNINFGFGVTTKVSGEEYPSNTAALNAIKNFWNFVYLHSQNLRFYDGTLSQLRARSPLAQGDGGMYVEPSSVMTYWTTQADNVLGAAKYDLFRYDSVTDNWVPASVDGTTLNMRTQYETFASELSRSTVSWASLSPLAVTNDAVDVRTAHFAANAETYMHVDDGLFHSAFVKFFAGTDNRAKNTYLYVDPVTLKIRFMQDDLDTTIKTNNIGQQRKPYYVEEHDKNEYGEFYWQGERNALFNLLETAFSDRLTTTMRRMLTAMAALGGSAMGYLESVVLQAQNYFPAVAYNEMTRLVYERAAVAQADGTYINNSAQAITQSNGTQHWSEWQWLTDRVMYISSWCEFGEFAAGTTSSGALRWRGAEGGTFAFTLTPAKWLYPRVSQGSSAVQPANNASRVRVQAGQTFAYKSFYNSSDSVISIHGINYYSEIGDMNIALSAAQQTTFEFAGKRLRKVVVNANGTDENLFVTQNINVTATNIVEFTVRGVDTLRGEVDLRSCTHLQSVDMRGSTPSSVRLPQTATLATVHLPATLESLNLTGLIGLSTFTIAGAGNIRTAVIPGIAASKNVATLIYTEQQTTRQLTSLTLTDVDWTNVSTAMLMWLAATEQCSMSGSIAIDNNPVLKLAQVVYLMEHFGDITSQSNDLYIDYTKVQTTSLGITGQKYFTQTGTTKFGVMAEDGVGNDIRVANGKPDITWAFIVDDGNGGEEESLTSGGITITDNHSGNAVITALNESGDETRQVLQLTAKCEFEGTVTTFVRRWKVGLFERLPQRGDFAFADGTFDDECQIAKTPVGYAIKVAQNNDKYVVDVMCANEVGSLVWGVYPNDTSGIPSSMRTAISAESGGISLTDFNIGNNNSTIDGTLSKSQTDNMTSRAKAIIRGWLKNLWDTIDLTAPAFSTEATYAVGSTVTYNSNVYLCKTAITAAGAWDSSKWSQVTEANLINMRSAKQLATASRLPQSRSELTTMTNAFTALEGYLGASSNGRFAQVFYLPAYCSYLYEPVVKDEEVLDDQYKIENWYLPNIGTLAVIYGFYHASRNKTSNGSPSASYANEDNSVTNANYPLMANVLKRYNSAGLNIGNLKLGTNSYYWSATENLSNYAWYVHFGNGTVNTGPKGNSFVVRPVAAFTYTPQGA